MRLLGPGPGAHLWLPGASSWKHTEQSLNVWDYELYSALQKSWLSIVNSVVMYDAEFNRKYTFKPSNITQNSWSHGFLLKWLDFARKKKCLNKCKCDHTFHEALMLNTSNNIVFYIMCLCTWCFYSSHCNFRKQLYFCDKRLVLRGHNLSL